MSQTDGTVHYNSNNRCCGTYKTIKAAVVRAVLLSGKVQTRKEGLEIWEHSETYHRMKGIIKLYAAHNPYMEI